MYDQIVTLTREGKEVAKGSLKNVDKVLYEYTQGYFETKGDKTPEAQASELLGVNPPFSANELLQLSYAIKEKKDLVWSESAKQAEAGTEEGVYKAPSPELAFTHEFNSKRNLKASSDKPSGKDPWQVTAEEAINLHKIARYVAYILTDSNPDWGDYVSLLAGTPKHVIDERKSNRE